MIRVLPVIFSAVLLQVAYGFPTKGDNDNVGIIGGYNVTIKDVPFIVSLHELTDNGTTVLDQTVCGGSVIHESFILTSASCVGLNVTRKIRGASDHWNDSGLFIDVDRVLCHEDFDRVNLTNDICLLKLKTPVQFEWLLLPELPELNSKLRENARVNVTGWGAVQNTITYQMKMSDTLHQVTIPVVSRDDCVYGGKVLRDTQICAGEKDHDICLGDGGCPLTNKNEIVGIVSYGGANVRCGDKPSVYTRVASFVDWIQITIKNNL